MSKPPSKSANDPATPPENMREVLAEYAGYMLQLATRLREAALDAQLAQDGLTITRLRVLAIIDRRKACNMGELAFLSSIDRTTLTRTVDQLTAQGLVERVTSPTDRRKVTLSLTAKGRTLHRKGRPAVSAVNRRVFGEVSDAQLGQMIVTLRQSIAAMVTDPRELDILVNFAASSRVTIDV
jgi:DNA-binding MarR family transcriptional regulator